MDKKCQYKVSVIVPVYNVEKYIERCVRSLFSQTMAQCDVQIILVDDCSTDKSLKVIEDVVDGINFKGDVQIIRHNHNLAFECFLVDRKELM